MPGDTISHSPTFNRHFSSAILIAGLVVTGLFWFDYGLNLKPCALCIMQRPPWFAVLVLLPTWYWIPSRTYRLLSLAFMCLLLLVGAGYALFQVGAEWTWWEGLQSCGGHWSTIVEIFVASPDVSNLPAYVPCTITPWRIFGLSLAGYNFILSLAELAILFLCRKALTPHLIK